MTDSISSVSPASPTPAPTADRAKLAAVARQFEAIFIRQMLAAARATKFGDEIMGSGASDQFRQMQDENFATIASEKGTFGLGATIERQLAGRLNKGAAK